MNHFSKQDYSWKLPPASLLQEPPVIGRIVNESFLENGSNIVGDVLQEFGVKGKITGAQAGPIVTLYEFEPAAGVRASKVIGLADDVARALAVNSVRIATVTGRNVIGIEVPNETRETVYLSELITSSVWQNHNGKLPVVLGKSIDGEPVYADLASMPHLLVGGTTGSGKSVSLNAMILSMLYRFNPEKLKFIFIDPKMLELSVYNGIPHLLAPVITDPAAAVTALKWAIREMERRYRAMRDIAVRNISGFNTRIKEAIAIGEVITRNICVGYDNNGNQVFENCEMILEELPYIVIIIDEMADLMMVAGKDVEQAVMRLAQMARAAGIHVIMATQRPSVDVITGTIKANFPNRISFNVASRYDSKTIINEYGAEQLLGQGDMLFMEQGKISRVHGPFVTEEEIQDVVDFWNKQCQPMYLDEVTHIEITEED